MDALPDPPCRFCRKRPRVSRLGLCASCNGTRAIRRLYLRRRPEWSPAWEARVEQLALRAFLRLPLFPLEPYDDESAFRARRGRVRPGRRAGAGRRARDSEAPIHTGRPVRRGLLP